MLVPPQGSKPEPAPVRWSTVVDLTHTPPSNSAHVVAGLINPRLVGQEVTVRLGPRRPYDLDCRVAPLLADAQATGVRLTIEADPSVIGYWLQAIEDHRSVPSRHLRVVRP